MKEKGIYHSVQLLFVSTLFSIGVLILRMIFTGSYRYVFLNWNLILAAVPWVISVLLLVYPAVTRKKLLLIIFLFLWFLFLPNAPYILTDLLHLNYWNGPNLWFDLVLILAYAWSGLLFGFFSLLNIEKILSAYISPGLIRLISSAALFACGLGVYLGRYARWNSWDIIHSPFSLLGDVADRFVHPFSHPRTWAMTILVGILLNIIYYTFKSGIFNNKINTVNS